MAVQESIAFIFPLMPGDLNPSLPVARTLVELGHKVFNRDSIGILVENGPRPKTESKDTKCTKNTGL